MSVYIVVALGIELDTCLACSRVNSTEIAVAQEQSVVIESAGDVIRSACVDTRRDAIYAPS